MPIAWFLCLFFADEAHCHIRQEIDLLLYEMGFTKEQVDRGHIIQADQLAEVGQYYEFNDILPLLIDQVNAAPTDDANDFGEFEPSAVELEPAPASKAKENMGQSASPRSSSQQEAGVGADPEAAVRQAMRHAMAARWGGFVPALEPIELAAVAIDIRRQVTRPSSLQISSLGS